MALKATIFKAELQVSDLDRGHFETHMLTVARHPSETDERMMVRLLAFALNADGALEFGRGLSAEDEPDLVKKDLTGQIELWIEVGLPDEREVRKAAGRADEVKVFAYGARSAGLWWAANGEALSKLKNVSVLEVTADTCEVLKRFAARNMKLSCTVQDGHAWFACGDETLSVELRAFE